MFRHHNQIPSRRVPARGFTLTEVICSMPLVLILFGTVFSFTMRGQELARVESVRGDLEQTTMRAVERLADDIRRTGGNRMVPNLPLGTEHRLELLPVIDIEATGSVIYAARPVIYEVTYLRLEIPRNGIDDDNNGLIDDGLLVRTSPEGQKAIIAAGGKGGNTSTRTAFNGFRFRRTAGSNRLRVALTLQKVDSRGALVERTYNSSITIRN